MCQLYYGENKLIFNEMVIWLNKWRTEQTRTLQLGKYWVFEAVYWLYGNDMWYKG
jgi:hypothetical protein